MQNIYVLILFLLFSLSTSAAKVLYVGEKQQFNAIKPAIESAMDGDSVIVMGGFYKEGNIVINKSISLIGVNRPIIDGDRRYEVITIKKDFVSISGFKIQHSGYATLDDPGGIKINGANHVTITNNILYDNFFGVYIQMGKHCLIKNNKISAISKAEQQIGNGIHCWKSDSLQIIGNEISGHRDGIYFEFVTHSVVWRNLSHDNIRYGLHFMFSNDDSYFTKYFKQNGAGVAVMFTKNVTMMNNTFEDNWGDAAYGLLLKEISDSNISGNRFINNTTGIYMEGTSRIWLDKNLFRENGWGIKIMASCMDNSLRKNDFYSNSFDVSTNGNVVLNHFEGNYWDRYHGYDLNKDGIGDVTYHPLSMFGVVVEKMPSAMLLHRSFFITLLDNSEKVLPSLTPSNFEDKFPSIKPSLI